MNSLTCEKFANSLLYTADFAPIGRYRQRLAHLADHDADFTRRDLHPGVLFDDENRPELESQPRHKELFLIACFALKSDRVVSLQRREGEALVHKTNLGGSDALERLEKYQRDYCYTNQPDQRKSRMVKK